MEAEIQTELMVLVDRRIGFILILELLVLVHYSYIKPSYTVTYSSCHVRTNFLVTLILGYARSKAEIEKRRHITLHKVVTGFGIYRNHIVISVWYIHKTCTYTCIEMRRKLTSEP